MTSEIYDKSREDLIRVLEELKLFLRKSEAEREEFVKNFLNQRNRIEILEATAEDLNERLAHQQSFSRAVLDRLRISSKEKDQIAKKLSWSIRKVKNFLSEIRSYSCRLLMVKC